MRIFRISGSIGVIYVTTSRHASRQNLAGSQRANIYCCVAGCVVLLLLDLL